MLQYHVMYGGLKCRLPLDEIHLGLGALQEGVGVDSVATQEGEESLLVVSDALSVA